MNQEPGPNLSTTRRKCYMCSYDTAKKEGIKSSEDLCSIIVGFFVLKYGNVSIHE